MTTDLVRLLSDDLDENPLAPAAVELAVEDLLPGTEVQLAVGDRDHYLASHHLPFDVGIRVVLPGIVMAVLTGRLVGRHLFQPDFVVVMQAPFVIIDED